jgi:ribosomal protein S18 acetylase RimI-like enzyme
MKSNEEKADCKKLSPEEKSIASTLRQVFQNFHFQPSVALASDHTAKSFISGWDAFFFNNILLEGPSDPENLISEIKHIHGSLKKPLMIWTTPETIQDKEARLTKSLESAFSTHGAFFGMLLDLSHVNFSADLSPDITIEAVHDEQSSTEFSKILCHVFQMRLIEDKMAQWALQQTRTSSPGAINYVAKCHGVPAGVSSLFLNSPLKTGGLYNAAVLPEYRKSGVGTAMAEHRAQVAHSMGLETLSIILMSDAMALGYCERMGFKKICEFTPYFVG